MTQRPDIFQLDRNHPLAKGLVFAGLGFSPGSGAMFDSSLLTKHGTLTNMDPSTDWVFVPKLGRWGLDFDGSNDVVNAAKIPYPIYNFSASLWNAGTSSVDNSGLIGEYNTLTNSRSWLLAMQAGNQVNFWDSENGSSGTKRLLYPYSTTLRDKWTHMCLVKTGTQCDLFVDGVWVDSDTAFASTYNGTQGLQIGGYNGGYAQGRIADPLVHTRALSPTEIADLADPSNIYLSGLIAGRPRRRYVFLGGGSTVEINATLASLELTGNAAGVSAGTDIAAGVGTLDATAQAASVSVGTTFTAGTGAIEATGLTADVSIINAIEASTGAVAMTGLAADVSVGVTLAATTGAIMATGLSATVSTGDSIEATTGAVELSGLAGSVSAGTTLTASTGAANLSGLAADVSTGTTITGSLATLVAAALAADVSAAVSIEATTPAMEWTARAASVSTSESITRQLFFGIKTGGAL